jgi:hypothetical protein
MISPFREATCLKIATHGGRRRHYRVITHRIYARQLHNGRSNHTHDADACSISSRRSVLRIRHWHRIGVTTASAQRRRRRRPTFMHIWFQPLTNGGRGRRSLTCAKHVRHLVAVIGLATTGRIVGLCFVQLVDIRAATRWMLGQRCRCIAAVLTQSCLLRYRKAPPPLSPNPSRGWECPGDRTSPVQN